MAHIAHAGQHPPRRLPGASRPGLTLALAAFLGSGPTIAVLVLVVGHDPGAVAAALLTLNAGSFLACRALDRAAPHDRLGLANLVTLIRLMVVSALVGLFAAGEGTGWTTMTLAALAVPLDGVDGWIARRQRMTSRFGARFDMEVDAALALVLAGLAAQRPDLGPWVLLLGTPRYAFGLAALALPWLRRALPERLSRKAVCVLQLGALIAIQLPALPDNVGRALVAGTVLALALSFGRDILWLHLRRA